MVDIAQVFDLLRSILLQNLILDTNRLKPHVEFIYYQLVHAQDSSTQLPSTEES